MDHQFGWAELMIILLKALVSMALGNWIQRSFRCKYEINWLKNPKLKLEFRSNLFLSLCALAARGCHPAGHFEDILKSILFNIQFYVSMVIGFQERKLNYMEICLRDGKQRRIINKNWNNVWLIWITFLNPPRLTSSHRPFKNDQLNKCFISNQTKI